MHDLATLIWSAPACLRYRVHATKWTDFSADLPLSFQFFTAAPGTEGNRAGWVPLSTASQEPFYVGPLPAGTVAGRGSAATLSVIVAVSDIYGDETFAAAAVGVGPMATTATCDLQCTSLALAKNTVEAAKLSGDWGSAVYMLTNLLAPLGNLTSKRRAASLTTDQRTGFINTLNSTCSSLPIDTNHQCAPASRPMYR